LQRWLFYFVPTQHVHTLGNCQQGGKMFIVVADGSAARGVHLHNHARPPVLSFFTEGAHA